jgi:apolipoprotein D and lipocalin family protein
MTSRQRPTLSPRTAAPSAGGFDDRRFSASIGTLATAFCVGSVLALAVLGTARASGRISGAPRSRRPPARPMARR